MRYNKYFGLLAHNFIKMFMKRCGSCNQIYNDDLNFCLTDGKLLLAHDDQEKTLLSPILPNYTERKTKKQNKTIFLTLFSLLAFGIVAFIAVYYYSKPATQENFANNSNSDSVLINKDNSYQQKPNIVRPSKTLSEIVNKLNLSVINFAPSSYEIPSEAKPFLREVAEDLKKVPQDSVIEISGHTDNVGNPAANQKLSEARANSIRKQLIEYGVNSNMLIAKGYGGSRPKADNSTDDGRFMNRRMEYTVISQ